jgi:Fic-DOC domain mobile mystery protein B
MINDNNSPPGATLLSPEELEGLKLKHITSRGELDRWEQDNIQDAFAWLQKRRKSEILNEHFICLLHEKMFNRVWAWSGKFRRTDKNIGVQWAQIPLELRQLLNDTKAWIEFGAYSPDEIAFRFHHRLVWIHLFPNGNGRHSRLMTDIILAEKFNLPPFSWGGEDLSGTSELRSKYIHSLRAADDHDYKLLEQFVRS